MVNEDQTLWVLRHTHALLFGESSTPVENRMKSAAVVVFGVDDARSFDSAKKLVALGFPAGATFNCGWCNHTEKADVARIAQAITGSWPECHGARMQIVDSDAVDAVGEAIAEPIFRITLRSLPNPAPSTVRLRQLLKLSLRVFGFRCVDVRQVEP